MCKSPTAGNFLFIAAPGLLGPFPVVIDPIFWDFPKHASTAIINAVGYSFCIF